MVSLTLHLLFCQPSVVLKSQLGRSYTCTKVLDLATALTDSISRLAKGEQHLTDLVENKTSHRLHLHAVGVVNAQLQ